MTDEMPNGANLYITHCVHGLDLRLNARCYLCKPEITEAEASVERARIAAVTELAQMAVTLAQTTPRRRGGFLSPVIEGSKDVLAEFGLWGDRR